MKRAKPKNRGFRRDGPWPLVLFVVVMFMTLSVQFGLEAFSRGMGLSCDVTGVLRRTPEFAGAASILLLFTQITWGPGRALRAIGYGWSLHLMNAGVINLIVHGAWGCYLNDNPPWLETHPEPTGWIFVAAGALLFMIVRFLSMTAHRSEEK